MKKEKFIEFNKMINNEYDLSFIPENIEFTNGDKFKIIHKPCGNEMMKSYREFSRKRNLENKTKGCKFCSGKVVENWNEILLDKLGEEYEILNHIENKSTIVKYRHKKCNMQNTTSVRNILKNCKCGYCSKTRKKSLDEVKKTIEENTANEYRLISEEYINSDAKLKIKHEICGNEFNMRYYCFVNGQRCPICRRSSKGENLIREYLNKNNIKFEEEVIFDELKYKKNLRFDFKIYLNSKEYFLLEFDGKQHFFVTGYTTKEQLKLNKKRDEIKNKFCIDNGIKLLRINYKDIKKINSILDNYINSTTIPMGVEFK